MITILSFGGGQDSTAILYKIIYDPIFRAMYVKGVFIVVMSDTGNEHPATYAHVEEVRELCKKHGIIFVLLTNDKGYHPRTWPGLVQWMKKHSGIMSKAFPKSCTDNLKIKPIYNWLDHFIARSEYNQYGEIPKGKTFIKKYVKEKGEKIRVLLGIAAGEERRIGGEFAAIWMNKCLERIYPLVEQGIDRQGCQDIISGYGHKVPPPSNCMLCPFMSDIELLWLYRNYPASYYDWVNMEQNKIDKWRSLGKPDEKNLGVNGTKLLPQKLKEAIDKHGHMSNEELDEYKMSHGHCVKSKY